MFKSIISGIDLGPGTGRVLSYAAAIAASDRASLRLLYVIDYLMTPPSYVSGYIEEERKREENMMAGWKSGLLAQGIAADSEIILGRLTDSFIHAINENAADLLVIGYSSHLLRQSSSEHLIKSLKVLMLVVRGKAASQAAPENHALEPVRIGKILCPVDFSQNSLHAVSTAKALASMFSADLHLLHIVDQSSDQTPADSVTGLAALCREHGIGNEGLTAQGVPAKMISSTAEEKGFDLIVMGARGLSYLETLLIGSTTEAVLKSSPCPVFIVH